MDVVTRDAVPSDAAGIAALSTELAGVLREAGNPVSASLSRDRIREDLFGPSPAAWCVVAEAQEGELVGYLLWHPAYDPDLGGRILRMVDLCVRRSARRRGIGRLLAAAVLERASQVGAHAVSWWIRERNRDGVAFYRSLGARASSGLLSMHLGVPCDPAEDRR